MFSDLNIPQVIGLLQEALRIVGCPDRSPSVPTPRLPLYRQDDSSLAFHQDSEGSALKERGPSAATPELEVAGLPKRVSKVGAGFPTVAQFPWLAQNLIAFVKNSKRTLALSKLSLKPEFWELEPAFLFL